MPTILVSVDVSDFMRQTDGTLLLCNLRLWSMKQPIPYTLFDIQCSVSCFILKWQCHFLSRPVPFVFTLLVLINCPHPSVFHLRLVVVPVYVCWSPRLCQVVDVSCAVAFLSIMFMFYQLSSWVQVLLGFCFACFLVMQPFPVINLLNKVSFCL